MRPQEPSKDPAPVSFCTFDSQCNQISSESSDTKTSAGCTFSIATATFFKNLIGRNINISKQKMHALPHSSHSTEDNLQFLEIRHDIAIKICQMEFRPHSQLWHVSAAIRCQVEPEAQSHLRASCFWSRLNTLELLSHLKQLNHG